MTKINEDGEISATTSSDVAVYKDRLGTTFRRPLIKKKKKIEDKIKVYEDALAGAGTGGGNANGTIYANPTNDSKIGTSSVKMGKNSGALYASDKPYRYNKKKNKKKIEEKIEEFLGK